MTTVVITGSHAVGKTSLCVRISQLLSERGVDVKVIPEMARILIGKGIPMNDKVNEFGIVSYILTYLQWTRETKANVVVSDRSLFDLFAYISVSRPAEVRDEFVFLAEELVRQEVERVATYVYVPIEFELQLDGVRPADMLYQQRIDGKIRELLCYFGARVLRVSGTLEQRAQAVGGLVNGPLS